MPIPWANGAPDSEGKALLELRPDAHLKAMAAVICIAATTRHRNLIDRMVLDGPAAVTAAFLDLADVDAADRSEQSGELGQR